MSAPLQIACVGTGGIAVRHLEAIQTIPDVSIVGVAGRSLERAAPLASRFGARPFADVEQMLDELRPDALLICLIPAAHGPAERAALARRIPFLVEKPLAIDWATAAELAGEVERAGLVTAVGYQWRYHRTVERARELLAGRRVGLVQGYWLTTTPAPAWWSKAAQSGGQLVEQLTHMLDLARWLVGEARTVSAMTARFGRDSHPDADIDEVSAATVGFQDGVVGTFAATHLLPVSYRVGLHVFCEGLALEIGAQSLIVDDGRVRTEVRGDGEATLRQDRAFLEAVRAGDPGLVRSPYRDALATHRLTTRALEAARTGQVLPVHDAAAVGVC